MWCPDCVAVESLVRETFEGVDAPKGIIHWVGQREEWKLPGGAENEARKVWGVTGVPTVMKIQEVSEIV